MDHLEILKEHFTMRNVKDEQHTTYVILVMLCNRWTSMISANFSWNACVKKIWNISFFYLQVINTNIWIPNNFNYRENLTISKFLGILLFFEGGGFVVI